MHLGKNFVDLLAVLDIHNTHERVAEIVYHRGQVFVIHVGGAVVNVSSTEAHAIFFARKKQDSNITTLRRTALGCPSNISKSALSLRPIRRT